MLCTGGDENVHIREVAALPVLEVVDRARVARWSPRRCHTLSWVQSSTSPNTETVSIMYTSYRSPPAREGLLGFRCRMVAGDAIYRRLYRAAVDTPPPLCSIGALFEASSGESTAKVTIDPTESKASCCTATRHRPLTVVPPCTSQHLPVFPRCV